MDYEYGIIGGGPAGYTAGMLLAKKGYSVILFEKDKLGGTCLNMGCIPTKSLIHSSEVYRCVTEAKNFGIDYKIENLDFKKIAEKRDKTIEKVRRGLEFAVKNSGVNVVYQQANIKDEHTITAGDKEYEIGTVIYAAGAVPRNIKGLEFDGKFILNSDDVLRLNKLPKKILIIGSGAVGIEFSRIFSNFGCEVILVEMEEHLIPTADIDVSKRVERIFKLNGIKYYLKNSVDKILDKTVILKSGEIIEPDCVLVAAGRTPLKPNIAAGISVLGDSCGEIQLAHYAIHHAREFVLGENFNKNLTPFIIYGEPEIAWVGVREQDCTEDCKITIFPITALGKSWCDDCTEGFIKIISKDDKIIGAHIVSKEASALIHELLIAIQYNLSIEDLKKVCFAHPTYSEGIFEAICRI